MLENIVFSLNRVLPFFALILLGFFLVRRRVLPEEFFSGLNRFVYRVALPVNLFLSVCTIDWAEDVNPRFILFIFLATVGSYACFWLLSEFLWKDKTMVGTLVQGSFRGNYFILGVPLLIAVVGEQYRGPASLLSAVVIPTYNALSVVALLVRGNRSQGSTVGTVVKGVAQNPLIIGTALGLVWSVIPLELPVILDSSMGYISQCVTGLGLISVGGVFRWSLARSKLKPAVYASFLKLIALPVLGVLACWLCGFRGIELFFAFAVFANPTAVSSYSTAAEMGGDGPLAANILIITTLVSVFTLALGIYLMRTVGWI